MNLPNKLTIMRIALIPVFVTLFFLPFPFMRTAALGIFGLASLTDMLDGKIARKNNLVTELGKFLDPIADKMLVICALVAVCVDRIIFAFGYFAVIILAVATMIIICRELAVSAFRIIAAGKGVKLAADNLGKIKTVLQMIAVLILIPVGDFLNLGGAWAVAGSLFLYSGIAVLTAATVMTVVSGVNYIAKNNGMLKNSQTESEQDQEERR